LSRVWLLFALPLCLVACGDSDDDDPPADPSSAGAGGDSGIDDCPDPNNPGVHYRTRDVSQCPVEELMCEDDQFGFHNACGCGCIDQGTLLCDLDPDTVSFISQDPAECEGVRPACELGQVAFNNSCGCGCRPE
jgi:hypothetical protein